MDLVEGREISITIRASVDTEEVREAYWERSIRGDPARCRWGLWMLWPQDVVVLVVGYVRKIQGARETWRSLRMR